MPSSVALLALVGHVTGLDNGVGQTPAMGYNTWDDFRCGGISAANVMKVADAFERYGLKKYGYEYIGIDDCWAVSRDKAGKIVEDPKAFPDGMKAVADYVHSKGLKFGIYTDRGTATCVGRPGSQGFEKTDAETYAAWGVDLVKEDSCSAPSDHPTAFKQYGLMRDALNATGRPIYFALCGWSSWYAPVGKTLGNSWRFSYDVNDWNSAVSNAILGNVPLAQYAGPGGWNDPDALIGTSTGTAVHMSQAQSRTQMNLWSTMAAPLEIGSNILNLSAYDLETYTNTEVIAIDQDPLGEQGTVVAEYGTCNMAAIASTFNPPRVGPNRVRSAGTCSAPPDCQQVWTRNLSDGGVALTIVNYTLDTMLPTAEGGGGLEMAPCDATDQQQQWKMKNGAGPGSGEPTTIGAAAGDHGCWEINGCNYSPGAGIDTNFGCKPPPGKGVVDPCCSNMAFVFNANATITSAFSGLCFEVGAGGGGRLEKCKAGSTSQLWGVRGVLGKQQIVSQNSSQCITRKLSPLSAFGDAATVTFDVVASLGWTAGAHVRDLWQHKDLGATRKIVVSLNGGGDSKIYKLTKA